MQLLLLLFQIISACLFLWCISNQILFSTVFLSIPLYLNIISYFSLFHFFFLPCLSFLLFHLLLISSLSHHFLTFPSSSYLLSSSFPSPFPFFSISSFLQSFSFFSSYFYLFIFFSIICHL